MRPRPAMSKSSQPCSPSLLHLLFLLFFLLSTVVSGITAASLRDHRLRESNAPANGPNEDMLKALQFIRNLRQTASEDQPNPDSDQQREEPRSDRQEDKSEELLQAVLSTLQQTEAPADSKIAKTPKEKVVTTHQKLPLMFEDDQEGGRSDEFDRGETFKRMNENVEEKYTPQTLATLQSVFDELGKVANFNSKRENQEEEEEEEDGENGEDLLSARDLAYDDGEWGQDEAEEERQEMARALDYLDANDQGNSERFVSKRSNDDDEDEGEMANLADFYLLKVLEQTEEEEQKKRELEEEEEEEEERMERAAEFQNSIDPKWIYRLLQISQKYQIPPEDLIDMLRSGERLKIAPVYTRKTYKKPQFFSRRLPARQKTPDEMRTERIMKILGLSGDENSAQIPYRKQYKNVYARPTWRQGSSIARQQQQQQQKFPTKLKDDYDDTENELATFLAARMLSKYPSYKSSQKREDEREEEAESFERAVRDYFEQLDSNRNEKGQMDVEQRGAEGFDNEDVMKLLNFVNPEEQDAKNTE